MAWMAGEIADLDKLYTTKQMTYKVTLGTNSVTYDDAYYKRIVPIARWNAEQYAEQRKVTVEGAQQDLMIEEYYPKNYEIKK